jgi:RNA polymerase sigma-B factor
VQRYRYSPDSEEELMQVGFVGLVKAINNFDGGLGHSLAAYALPCVSGEIKRYFRDKRWHVRVKRSAQELRLELRNATAELTHVLGRAPKDSDLAEHLGITLDDLTEARRAEQAFQASSLDAPLAAEEDSASLADYLGAEDPQLAHVLDMDAVWTHWPGLPEREQHLLLMRFYGNMTQAEIGEQLGISQMHVSRLLTEALSYLRDTITGPEPAAGQPDRPAVPPVKRHSGRPAADRARAQRRGATASLAGN